jgi:hypothetical protein
VAEPVVHLYITEVKFHNATFTTIPGGKVGFRGGEALVYDARMVPWALRRADVVVTPCPRYLDQISAWCRRLPEDEKVKATIVLPEGYTLDGAPDYALHAPDAVEPEEAPAYQEFMAAVDEAMAPNWLPKCEWCGETTGFSMGSAQIGQNIPVRFCRETQCKNNYKRATNPERYPAFPRTYEEYLARQQEPAVAGG